MPFLSKLNLQKIKAQGLRNYSAKEKKTKNKHTVKEAKGWITRTGIVVSEACPMCQGLDHLTCSGKDPSSPNSSNSPVQKEFFHLYYYYKVPWN